MTQHYSGRLLYDDAKAQGFAVDRTCYPWVGYKGLRFAPTEAVDVYTELETTAITLLRRAKGSVDDFGLHDAITAFLS